MVTVGIHLDQKTKNLIDEYAEEHSLSRSSVIKLSVNEFFLKNEEAG